jgi:hypothetical protein
VEDMNTQLAEQQEQMDPMDHALALTIAAFDAVSAASNANIDQSNLQVDELERISNENSFLTLQVKNLTTRLDDVIGQNEQLLEARKNDEKKEAHFNKTAELVRTNAEQIQRQAEQSKIKLEEALFTVARYKELGSPKQIRDKNKKYQATITSNQKAETARKVDVKEYLHEIKTLRGELAILKREALERDFQKAYSKGGDNLIIYPRLCETINNDKVEKQVPIWFATDAGIGALYMLNEDGEPARSPTPKTGIKPKPETMKVMKTMLLKFQRNGDVVHAEDIQMLEAM